MSMTHDRPLQLKELIEPIDRQEPSHSYGFSEGLVIGFVHETVEGTIVTPEQLTLQLGERLIRCNTHMEIILVHGDGIQSETEIHKEELVGHLSVTVE